jgi:hypothetical protein
VDSLGQIAGGSCAELSPLDLDLESWTPSTILIVRGCAEAARVSLCTPVPLIDVAGGRWETP